MGQICPALNDGRKAGAYIVNFNHSPTPFTFVEINFSLTNTNAAEGTIEQIFWVSNPELCVYEAFYPIHEVIFPFKTLPKLEISFYFCKFLLYRYTVHPVLMLIKEERTYLSWSHECPGCWWQNSFPNRPLSLPWYLPYTLNGWMINEWTNELVNECMNGWMNEKLNLIFDWLIDWLNKWMNEWMNEWMNKWINEFMNKWIYEWMNKWMNLWMNE